ncbi:glycosyltransferase family 1 protein [Schumannella sp. 10F1B-5-1]|uniref:glycosyltransferase family 4 protein n=1 Tax=Schumannella sp. 10F1B-5-1 TaxID=2590780 RepID=UPI00113220D7|nr:glycosyltransferase family 1 protein [Schumannella sp. 10F1B-5-1]TPW73558.1 glycosyltransferase family 4 protein [Schumannella sp. 10F1B-5-1]
MTTLRVVIDGILDPSTRGLARYTEDLTRALIATAPRDCDVEGIVSASRDDDYRELERRLPGMSGLLKSVLARREMAAVWQHGFTVSPIGGMIHAPSLLAPLRKHDRAATGDQMIVTVHDALPWTAPETISGRPASWHQNMIKRAERYADAIVVPTHAVAAQLAEHADFGDRVRVIGGAVSPGLLVPDDVAERLERLGLPETYVLTLATLNPRKALRPLLTAMSDVEAPLVIAGDPAWGDDTLERAIDESGIPSDRVVALGAIDDDDLAVAYSRARVMVNPSRDEGFGLASLEAFAFGAPVVSSDAPALTEVAADAAHLVERSDDDAEYAARLREGIELVLRDGEVAQRLSTAGADRSRAYSWRDAAEKVWQLHADI